MDVIELNLLSGLQNKRALTARMEAQQAAGMQVLASRSNQMSTAALSNGSTVPSAASPLDTSTLGGGPGALVNRSPTTNYHYYNATPPVAPGPVVIEPPAQIPAPTPPISPWWLLAIPLAVAASLLAYYLLKPAPTPVAPPAWQGQTTIKLGDAP